MIPSGRVSSNGIRIMYRVAWMNACPYLRMVISAAIRLIYLNFLELLMRRILLLDFFSCSLIIFAIDILSSLSLQIFDIRLINKRLHLWIGFLSLRKAFPILWSCCSLDIYCIDTFENWGIRCEWTIWTIYNKEKNFKLFEEYVVFFNQPTNEWNSNW